MENLKCVFVYVLILLGFGMHIYADPVYTAVDDSGNGNITFTMNSGDPFTAFGNNFYVGSSSGRYSYVLPLNGILSNPTAFSDIDYIRDQNPDTGAYYFNTAYYGFTPIYKLSLSGHPRVSPDTETTYTYLLPGLTGDFSSVPAGKYTVNYTVKDESVLDQGNTGNVRDANCVVPVDVYLMDLKEDSRSLYMREDDVCRIDLSTIPATFPHEDICYISVAWSMMPPMPGMPEIESDLYTSADCSASSKILPDSLGGVSKKWQAGNAPHYIYYKKADSGFKTIYLRLYVENNSYQTLTLSEKTLSIGNTALYCHKASDPDSPFYDFCNGLLKDYPQNLWKDNETLSTTLFDGFAYEDHPYQNNIASQDKNTPFVVKMGDKLQLSSLELADTGASSYNGNTDYITSAGSYTFNSSHFDVTQYSGYKMLSCRSEMESVQAVSNTVDIKNLSLPWKVITSGGSNIASGSCDIKVYVPFATPLDSLFYDRVTIQNGVYFIPYSGLLESLLNISCKAAKGASTQSETFARLWEKIQTCQLTLLDGRVLQYYGDGDDTVHGSYDTGELLKEGDGRCGHWMHLFVDLLRSQGIPASYSDCESFSIGPNSDRGFLYNPVNRRVYKTVGTTDHYLKLIQTAARYQGGGHPDLACFQDHVINKYDGNYYDATCGAGPYEVSQTGFLQYLQNNVRIRVGTTQTFYQGSDLVIEDFDSTYYIYPIMH
ncbi:MAG: transglutaminase domain-containing protein [Abditibacteriota bacterium]|nr:transglutaminase domain-containing protein [Abditibacteriota bacterium]